MPEPLSYSTATPRLGLPMLFAGQAQKETTVNEALSAIDILLAGNVEGIASAPPASPVAGMAWIVGGTPTGAFVGHADKIAGWTEGGWRFIQPTEGMRTFDRASGTFRHYSGGWITPVAPGLPAGGSNVDVEARASLTALVTALEQLGIFSSD